MRELQEVVPLLDVWAGDVIAITVPVSLMGKEAVKVLKEKENVPEPENTVDFVGKVMSIKTVNPMFGSGFFVTLRKNNDEIVEFAVPRYHKKVKLVEV